MMEKHLPLHDIVVLDLTRHLPGPLATLLLHDLGAEILKIEHPDGGDPVRGVPPFAGEFGAAFAALNRGKKSLALDLKHELGKKVLLDLVGRADVVMEGFRPGVMKKLGLDYEALREVKPDIILCSITGYGQTGPLSARAGHDINYQARSGVLGLNGPPGGPPLPVAVQVADVCGAWQSVAAVLGALFTRQRTGRGQWLDVSLSEAAFTTIWLAAAELWAGSEPPHRGRGALSGGGLAGYGVFECSDGKYLAVGALEPKFFRRLCELLELEELAENWASMGADADEVRRRFAEAFAKKTRDQWMTIFASEQVCVEPVLEGTEILQDEQLLGRKMLIDVALGDGSTVRLPASPLRLEGSAARPELPPRLGEHTRQVLSSAGFDDDTIAELERKKVIA